jgi:histone H3/H4
MKVGDLSGGASKMALAMKQLALKWDAAREQWNDGTARGFHKDAIEPLTPAVKETLESIGRLAEVLARASRDVSDQDGM